MFQIRTDIKQGSHEWHQARLGKITGSSFYKLLGSDASKKKYLYDRANEIIIGARADSENFSTMHTERGRDFESEAKSQYVIKTFTSVKEVGLVTLDDYIACSPDGLVDDDGMLEIKVPDSNNYFRQILEISSKGIKAIPKEYYMQMQFNLYVCGRKWCDYVPYNPMHAALNKGLFTWRVEYEEKTQARIKETVEESIAKIKNYVKQYYTILC